MTESWTEAQIRAAFKGARRIPVYPGPDTTAEARTADGLMHQLRLQQQREQECLRWTGPWPDAGRECCPSSGVRRHDFAPDDWNGTPESCELCNHGPGHPIHQAIPEETGDA